MQEMTDTWLQSLGVEDALEKEMATHTSLLAIGAESSEPCHLIKGDPKQGAAIPGHPTNPNPWRPRHQASPLVLPSEGTNDLPRWVERGRARVTVSGAYGSLEVLQLGGLLSSTNC